MYCNVLGVLYFDPAYLKTCITCIFLHIYIQYITIPTKTYSTCIHSCTYLDEHNKFPWIASSSLSVSLPEYAFSVWSMLLLKCVWVWIFFHLYELMLETAADRDSRGEKATSIRVNAICEVRCVLDLSGPLSLSSISIYHHLPSQDHINVSPFCLTRSLLFLYSPTDIGVDPHSHSPTSAKNPKTTLNELARPIKRVQTTRHYLSGFYYSVGERQVDNRKMPMYCLQITNRCSCRSGESARIQLWITWFEVLSCLCSYLSPCVFFPIGGLFCSKHRPCLDHLSSWGLLCHF